MGTVKMHKASTNRQVGSQAVVPFPKINQKISDYALLGAATSFLISLLRAVDKPCRRHTQFVVAPDVVALYSKVVGKMLSHQNFHCSTILRIVGRERTRVGAEQRTCIPRKRGDPAQHSRVE